MLNFFNRLENGKLEKTDERGLGILLIDFQEFVLGEIYKINVVQIEHALTCALLKLISEKVVKKEEQYSILSRITVPKKITESQKERIKFLKILKLGKKLGVSSPKNSRLILWLIKKHANKYGFMYCAYGENPRSTRFYINQYKKLRDGNECPQKIKRNLRILYNQSKKTLKTFNDERIKILARLMSKIGTFRDKNKAFLGQTIKYRLRILNEVAKRGLEKRDALNFYLLSEILQLLDKREKVSQWTIKERKKNGVIFTRSEYIETGACFNLKNKKTSGISGNCASHGIVRGICKIVLNNEDVCKIEKGDIMVSPGTDFDLMEAIIKSAGVITEEGGLLSHASVVCREMLKPCCISVKNATEILKDGLFIELNATSGKIKILKS